MTQVENDIIEALPRLKAFVKNKMGWNEDWVDIYDDSIINALEVVRDGKYNKNKNIIGLLLWKARMMIYDYYKKPDVIQEIEFKQDSIRRNITKSEMIKYEHREEINAAEDRMSKLTWRNKRVAYLLVHQGMNHDEISDAMGISREAVSCMIMRVREITGFDLNKARDRK